MGVKISGIATQQSTPGNNDRFEISRLVSTGPDVWETDYIEWSDFITNLNGQYVPLSGTTTAITGIMEFDATSVTTALSTVDFTMYIGSGDDKDLDGAATRYGRTYYNSSGTNSTSGLDTMFATNYASVDVFSDATSTYVDLTTNGTIRVHVAHNGDATFYQNTIHDLQTASRIAIFDASKKLIAADTSTYPSLAELAYVKGVSSAIQTQFSDKADKNNTVLSSYIEIPEQAAPATPTNALRIYADTSNRLSWKGENGYTRTFDGTANTADRVYTLQDVTGTIALLGNKLSAFAATTSAELAGVISDETGSGALVFATSPSLTTPSLGVATATSINKVTLTQPATGSTLTIADGKTLTASNTLTFTGTDSTSFGFPAWSGNVMEGTRMVITTGDQTTTSASAGNITGLVTGTLTISVRYFFWGVIYAGCDNTGGVKFAVTLPTGASMRFTFSGQAGTANAWTRQTAVTSGTLTSSALITQNNSGHIFVAGEVAMSTTAGTVQFQFASGTAGQTSTIYQGATMLNYFRIT